MAAGNYGMLGLGGEEAARMAEEQRRRQQAAQLAQMTPGQQVGFARARAAGMLGEGIGNMARTGIGAATGVDTRNAAEVARTVREQLARANVDPSDPDKFYPALIDILRKNGMVAEAAAAAREYEEMSNKRTDRKLRERDIARKEKADAATGEFLRAKAAALKSSPKERILADYVQTLGRLEAGEYGSEEEKVALQRMLRAQEASLGVKPVKDEKGQWKVTVQQGNKTDPARVIKYNAVTGETIVESLDGKPISQIESEQAKGGGGKALESTTLDKWSTGVTNVEKLAALLRTFNPRFAGDVLDAAASGAGFGDLIQRLSALRGRDPQAAQWWSDYANVVVRIRHELFGATLTQGEASAFDAVRALKGMAPGMILGRVRSMGLDGIDEVESKINSARSTGKNVGDLSERAAAARAALNGAGAPAPAAAPRAAAPAPAAPGAVEVWKRGADGKLVKGS